jgi:hypothetical protein
VPRPRGPGLTYFHAPVQSIIRQVFAPCTRVAAPAGPYALLLASGQRLKNNQMKASGSPHSSAEQLRTRLRFADHALLAECDVHLHRTGGPGGQHRNKVASAVRLVHRPSGFSVTATERRSQHENRANALCRLREAIALGIRLPPTDTVRWPENVQLRDQQLRVGEGNPAYWEVVALVLDEFAAAGGVLAVAAARLGVSGSSLTRFLSTNPHAWRAANQTRKEAGLPPLRP